MQIRCLVLNWRCLQVLTDFPLKYMTAENKGAAQAAIVNVHSGGGTNLSGGLFKGIDQHQQLSSPQESVTEQPNVATGQYCRLDVLLTVSVFL